MSSLRSDMSGLRGGYVLSSETSHSEKSRLGAKIMRLGPDKLTISKLDNMELREIMGTTRSNLNARIQIYG
jgi:hypothetical protein